MSERESRGRIFEQNIETKKKRRQVGQQPAERLKYLRLRQIQLCMQGAEQRHSIDDNEGRKQGRPC